MNNTQKEPMVKHSSQVHTTTDYFLFKPIEGNRNKNLMHINRLKKSMSENYLFTVIIVNEKYEIIDGQHRFYVITELKLPLNYIVCEGYGLNEVHILNANAKTWNADDYLDGYCKLGYEDYIQYRNFKNEYKLGHKECQTILSGVDSHNSGKNFSMGKFKIKNYSESVNFVNKLLMIEPYYSGVRRRSFVGAMSYLMKNQNFDLHEFIQKLKQQPSSLTDCLNVNQYLIVIEEIYNYKRRIKIGLRF